MATEKYYKMEQLSRKKLMNETLQKLCSKKCGIEVLFLFFKICIELYEQFCRVMSEFVSRERIFATQCLWRIKSIFKIKIK